MAFRSVGTNLSRPYIDGVSGLAEDLEALKRAGPDFVEVWPQNLGVILGGSLDVNRLRTVGELLLEAELAYTVHAPLEVNLMDLSTHGLQRDVLNSSLRFAKGIGAEVVVCHAGQRVAARDARHSMEDQLSTERSALREAGDLAGELGVTIAVENYYPERPIVRGAIYDYSVWPSQLAEQIFAVDHPAVGICLDVGHAALAIAEGGVYITQKGWGGTERIPFLWRPDGTSQQITIPLLRHRAWHGDIAAIRVDPFDGHLEAPVRLDRVRLRGSLDR